MTFDLKQGPVSGDWTRQQERTGASRVPERISVNFAFAKPPREGTIIAIPEDEMGPSGERYVRIIAPSRSAARMQGVYAEPLSEDDVAKARRGELPVTRIDQMDELHSSGKRIFSLRRIGALTEEAAKLDVFSRPGGRLFTDIPEPRLHR